MIHPFGLKAKREDEKNIINKKDISILIGAINLHFNKALQYTFSSLGKRGSTYTSYFRVRPKRIFRDAAIKFLLENQHKRSISSDAGRLKILDPFIGELFLENIHMGTLQPFIAARQKEGMKTRTINHGLQVERHILNLAASEWMDDFGLTWLASAPKIKLLPETDGRKPYPFSKQVDTVLKCKAI